MARAGRKPKQGKRTESGRLSRAGMPAVTFDKGTERTQAMQALYGPDGSDAIGRAYRAGLLGEGSEAKAILDTARKISNAYWVAYETGRYQNPLADRTHGSTVNLDHERIKRREIWLSECLSFVKHMGPQVRRAFDQLVIDVNPDSGPQWLEHLIWAKRHDKPSDMRCEQALRAALDALEQLC